MLGYLLVGIGGILVGALLTVGFAEVVEVRELRRIARERKRP